REPAHLALIRQLGLDAGHEPLGDVELDGGALAADGEVVGAAEGGQDAEQALWADGLEADVEALATARRLVDARVGREQPLYLAGEHVDARHVAGAEERGGV